MRLGTDKANFDCSVEMRVLGDDKHRTRASQMYGAGLDATVLPAPPLVVYQDAIRKLRPGYYTSTQIEILFCALADARWIGSSAPSGIH